MLKKVTMTTVINYESGTRSQSVLS